MKAPDRLYVDDLAVVNDRRTKVSVKPLPNFSEYIREDALVEKINKQILFYQNSVSINDYEEGCNKGAIAALEHIVKSL